MNELIVLVCLLFGFVVSGVLVKFMGVKDAGERVSFFYLLTFISTVVNVLMVGVLS